jgi:NAD(P)H-nitrite reductase large subunit
MNHVIIGNSFAALFAMEAIRRTDQDAEITVISREPQHVYSRAMIHEMLAGMVQEPMVYLRDWDFYQNLRVRTMLGRTVTRIDPAMQTVTTDDGEEPYDRLLIATGGKPFVPPLNGLQHITYHSFITLEDAQKLKAACEGRHDAVVLGAGLIGLQCAEGLRHLGLNVTVVEMADTVLPMALDAESSQTIAKELADEGIAVYTGDTIDLIMSEDGQPTACKLRSGGKIPCDLVVIAVGVRPNIDLAKDAGITTDRGIVVNDRMETSVENIYSAGDCAQGPEIVTGMTMPIPVIPVASTQGMVAGNNMAGKRHSYRGGLALNSMQFGGVQIVSYGFIKDERDGEVLKSVDPARKIYKKVIIKNGRITGAIFVKDIDRTGIFRHLIEKRIDVTSFKEHLLASNFGVAHLPAEIRRDMFTRPQ